MTSWLAHYGVLAIFVLMFVDAIFPAASELVMVYAGALASGALTHRVDVFGWHGTGLSAYIAVVLAGVVGYQLGSILGWWIGGRGGAPVPRASRPLVPSHPAEARSSRAVVRALGSLGGVARAGHPGRTLLRLDPGRRLREPLCPLQRPDPDRQRRLVHRAGRSGLGARVELGNAASRLPLRRGRRRGGN